VRSLEIFGGVNINPQIDKLRRGVDVLIATPGRLIDRIVKALPKQRQTLLFSATFSSEIELLAGKYLRDPVLIETAPPNSTVELIAQQAIHVDQGRKRELLSWMIADRRWEQVLVLTRTKHGANRLAKQLTGDGLPAAAIHGNKSQGARTRALAEFKQRRIRVLVATDIAARGLDIDQLPFVVNYEIPNVPEDYVHRIGRTGRAGRDGLATSLISADERPLFDAIRKLTGIDLPAEVIEGYEAPGQTGIQPLCEPEAGFEAERSAPEQPSPGHRRRQCLGRFRVPLRAGQATPFAAAQGRLSTRLPITAIPKRVRSGALRPQQQ
jgi:ATP-dependent RNA helicase RhlE